MWRLHHCRCNELTVCSIGISKLNSGIFTYLSLPAVYRKVVEDLVDLRTSEEWDYAREELSVLISNASEQKILAVVSVLDPFVSKDEEWKRERERERNGRDCDL